MTRLATCNSVGIVVTMSLSAWCIQPVIAQEAKPDVDSPDRAQRSQERDRPHRPHEQENVRRDGHKMRGRDGRRGGRPRHDGYHAPRPLWSRMSPEDRDSVLDFMETHFPKMGEELERVRTQSPERYERRMRRITREMMELMEVLEENPERGALALEQRQLHVQIRMLSRKYHRTTDPQVAGQIRNEMRKAIGEAFDIRHQLRGMTMEELESQLVELRQRHERAPNKRDEIITRELERRLRSRDEHTPHGKPHAEPRPPAEPNPTQPE